MEIIKNKKKILTTILLLFAISGLCNIVNVSADTDLPPLSYLAYGRELKSQEGLKISVSSSGTVNVYIMDSSQYEHLKASGGLSWVYYKRWQDVFHLEYTYTVPYDDAFYVVVYNKNVLFGRTVEVNIEVIPYFNVGILIFSIGVIIGLVVIVVSASRYKKKKKEAEIIQVQEGVKPKTSFCSNCGAESIGITSEYCPKCGSKV